MGRRGRYKPARSVLLCASFLSSLFFSVDYVSFFSPSTSFDLDLDISISLSFSSSQLAQRPFLSLSLTLLPSLTPLLLALLSSSLITALSSISFSLISASIFCFLVSLFRFSVSDRCSLRDCSLLNACRSLDTLAPSFSTRLPLRVCVCVSIYSCVCSTTLNARVVLISVCVSTHCCG